MPSQEVDTKSVLALEEMESLETGGDVDHDKNKNSSVELAEAQSLSSSFEAIVPESNLSKSSTDSAIVYSANSSTVAEAAEHASFALDPMKSSKASFAPIALCERDPPALINEAKDISQRKRPTVMIKGGMVGTRSQAMKDHEQKWINRLAGNPEELPEEGEDEGIDTAADADALSGICETTVISSFEASQDWQLR